MTDERDAIVRAVETAPVLSLDRQREKRRKTPRGDADDGYDVEEMNRQYAYVVKGGTGMIACFREDGEREFHLTWMRLSTFEQLMAPHRKVIVDGTGKPKDVSYADVWMRDPARRTYEGVEFYPDPNNEPGRPGFLNLWRGFSVVPKPGGKYTVFRDHLLNNVCGGDERVFDWVWGWFAHMFQKPRDITATSIVLRGKMGTGKTVVGDVMGSLIEDHYFLVDSARYVTGQFNSHLEACLLLQADEAVWAGDKTAEGRLKGMISAKRTMIEKKGVDQTLEKNRVHVIQTTNEDWVVPAGKEERRFCVLDVVPNVMQNHEYFAEMMQELDNGGREALLHDLLAFNTDHLDLREAPKTAGLLEQKTFSLRSVEAWWLGRLEDGAPITHRHSWPEMVLVSDLLEDFSKSAERAGVKHRGFETEVGIKLKKIIPGLTKARRFDADGNRRNYYLLPSLKEARAFFEKEFRQKYDWGEEADDAGQEPSEEIADL